MGAKMKAKRFRNRLKVPICDKADLRRMELCLRLKCRQHPELREKLIQTGSATIIEDCGRRRRDIEIDGKNHGSGGPFWGACLDPNKNTWDGVNALGVLWMKLRKEFQSGVASIPPNPPSFIGSLYPYQQPIYMIALKQRREALKAELAEIETIDALQKSFDAQAKKAGLKGLEQFIDKLLGRAEAAAAAPAAVAAKPEKRRRVRITAAVLAQMKKLRETLSLSQQKVADKIGCSVQTVANWEKRGFVFAKK
jgi:DNA-binding transcriptional regulator YiaG